MVCNPKAKTKIKRKKKQKSIMITDDTIFDCCPRKGKDSVSALSDKHKKNKQTI